MVCLVDPATGIFKPVVCSVERVLVVGEVIIICVVDNSWWWMWWAKGVCKKAYGDADLTRSGAISNASAAAYLIAPSQRRAALRVIAGRIALFCASPSPITRTHSIFTPTSRLA